MRSAIKRSVLFQAESPFLGIYAKLREAVYTGTMPKPYDNLRLYASGSLVIMPDGIMRGDLPHADGHSAEQDLPIVPMARIDRQQIGTPELAHHIAEDFRTYPARIVTFLENALSESNKRHLTENQAAPIIANIGLSLFAIPEGSHAGKITAMFMRSVKENGLTKALETYAMFAKAFASHIDIAQELTELEGYRITPAQDAAVTAQKQGVYALFDSLPHDLGKALNRLGATIVIGQNNNQSASIHGANTIIIDEKHLYDHSLQSQLIVEEECVHHIDSHLGFSDRKPWQDIANHERGSSDSDTLKRNVRRDILNGVIQKAGLSLYAIKNQQAYAPELLADTVRAMGDKLVQINPKITAELIEQTYGTVMPLAEQFLQEVKQLARGIHATQIGKPDAEQTRHR